MKKSILTLLSFFMLITTIGFANITNEGIDTNIQPLYDSGFKNE